MTKLDDYYSKYIPKTYENDQKIVKSFTHEAQFFMVSSVILCDTTKMKSYQRKYENLVYDTWEHLHEGWAR